MFQFIVQAKKWYDRYQRFNPVVFFFGGFTWDSVTLRRIDTLTDNLVLLLYIVAFGCLMCLTLLVDAGKVRHALATKYEKWFPLGLQFFLGGLFSAYVIFYFQSASLSKTGLFLLLLAGLLVANEFLEHKLKNVYLLLGLYFLASFSFFIFFIPVVFRTLNIFTFLSGGLLSLALVGGLACFLRNQQIFESRRRFQHALFLVGGIYLFMNLLYLFNWIPPVPLSLKSGGIYHHAVHDLKSDKFVLRYEAPRWYEFFKTSDTTYRLAKNDTVSCFTAVFAPTQLNTKIYHEWQMYSDSEDEWLTTDRLGFDITGYRDGGYRGITRKQHIQPGKWRVDVVTESGTLLGRIDFEIETASAPVRLETIYK